MENRMFANLFLSWWTFALRGFLAIVFGLLALIWAQQAMPGLVVIFGAFVLTDGIFGLLAGFGTMGSNERWWMALLQGAAGIIVGSIALMSLDKSAPALAYFIAACVVIAGVIELVAGIQLKRAILGEGSMIYCAASRFFWAFFFSFFQAQVLRGWCGSSGFSLSPWGSC
jgi:uncharacterized membrane protein HdeD (DUF308 family)